MIWKGCIKVGENCGIIVVRGVIEKRYKVRFFFFKFVIKNLILLN